MSWILWAGIGIIGFNVVFIGSLLIVSAIREWRDRHANSGSGPAAR